MPRGKSSRGKTAAEPPGDGALRKRGRPEVRVGVMPVCARVRRVLCEMRAALGLSMAEAARRAGIDRRMYARVEQGASVPSLDLLERICGGLETTLREVAELAG